MRALISRRSSKLAVAWFVLAITLLVAALALFRSLTTIGKPFAGFFYAPNLLVAVGQRAEWEGMKSGLKPMDKILAVDGIPLGHFRELEDRVEKALPGDTLIYEIERENHTVDIAVKVGRITLNDYILVFLVPYLLGMLFIFFGAMLYFFDYAPRGRLLYLMISCLIGIVGTSMYEAHTSFLFYRLLLIYPLIGALSVHLFSLFPESRVHHWTVKTLLYVIYGSAAVLACLKQLWLPNTYESALLSELSSLYMLGCLGFNTFFLIHGFYETRNQSIRDKIKVLGIGVFIVTSFLLTWASSVLSETKVFFLDEGLILGAAFPVFMGYAIVRNNIFQLDRIIRSGLSNGAAAIFVFALYLSVFGGLKYVFPNEKFSQSFRWLMIFFFFFLGFVFNHLRLKINAWVQQFLFRSQYNAREALAKLDRSLVAGLRPRDIAETVGHELFRLFELQRIHIVLFPQHFSSRRSISTVGASAAFDMDKHLSLFETEGLIQELVSKNHPLDIRSLETLKPGFFMQSIATLRAHEIDLLVPVAASGKLYAMMLLGKKTSGERFDMTDYEFFKPLAERMSIVLENADLSLEAEKQSRLAELGQMASILIHDIKNPLSTIRISSGSLKKRFKPGDPSHELATFIEEEAQRMDHTVSEILTYAKPIGVQLRPCIIGDLLKNLIDKLSGSFQKRGVSFEVDFDEKERPVEADASRLIRAFENLLVNALDASSPGSKIGVRTRLVDASSEPAKMEVVIQDFGHGMEPAVRDQVFKPFFTTKPSGTGLGLAIVNQIVQEHSGKLSVESQKGRGTKFTLSFPTSIQRG